MKKKMQVAAVLIFLVLPFFAGGCAEAENKSAKVSARQAWPEDGPLPELEQNKLDPHNFFPKSSQMEETFEEVPNDHQKLSEDEKLFLFPPASD